MTHIDGNAARSDTKWPTGTSIALTTAARAKRSDDDVSPPVKRDGNSNEHPAATPHNQDGSVHELY